MEEELYQEKTRVSPTATIILIAINVIVFLYTDLFLLSPATFIANGASGYYPVLHDHEYYRMVTSMFLHADLDHIFNNMLVLGVLGYYIEENMGHLRFLMLYFCSGLLAGCTSIVYNMLQMDLTTSIGASGAIFGLMGGIVFMVWHQHRNHRELDLRRLAFMVFLSLYGGFTSQGVDNAAHVGGFLSGILVTALLYLTLNRKGRNTT
ncbi:MAG: rhomboid family intramembrane serine protease [Eubacteriales bacterium]|nr:rhomboid family intramembrane serine protease [Eubacteriales bacterium]